MAMTNNPAVLAEVYRYTDLIDAMRARQNQLGISIETIEEISGLSKGLPAKILGPSGIKNLGPMSFGVMLETLGLKLLVVPDPQAEQKMRGKWAKRVGHVANTHPISIERSQKRFPSNIFRALSHRAAAARRVKIPAERRRQIARRAILARWRAYRANQRRERQAARIVPKPVKPVRRKRHR